MRASAALTLEGLRELAADPAAFEEARPLLRLILGVEEPGPAPLQSTGDAARRLGLSSRTVEKMARAGRLSGAVKIGNTWRVPTTAVPDAPDDAARDQAPVAAQRAAARRCRPNRARASRGSAESAMDAVITGRVRGTTPRSAPASAGTDRGRGPQRSEVSMDSRNGTAAGGATVTPIERGTR